MGGAERKGYAYGPTAVLGVAGRNQGRRVLHCSHAFFLVLDCIGRSDIQARDHAGEKEQTRTCKAQRCAASEDRRLPCVCDGTEKERRGKRDEDRRSAHPPL